MTTEARTQELLRIADQFNKLFSEELLEVKKSQDSEPELSFAGGTLLADREILALVQKEEMISPFVSEMVRESSDGRKLLSYGLGSYGYDIRLSSKMFKYFRHIPGEVVDPKDFNPDHLVSLELKEDEKGQYFILPGNTYGLGVAVEKLQLPDDVTCICIGKSTYCRTGVIANVSPGEAGWHGHLTLEFSNSSSADCRIYANEGVLQLLFFRGANKPLVNYATRKGKYQNQGEEIVLAKV